jgi:hypothetical protein
MPAPQDIYSLSFISHLPGSRISWMNVAKIEGFSWFPSTPWGNQATLLTLYKTPRKKIKRLTRIFLKLSLAAAEIYSRVEIRGSNRWGRRT